MRTFCYLVGIGVFFSVANVALASGGGKAADPFGLNPDLALWTLIIFAGTMAILWKYAFGPIAQALDAREKSVRDEIAAAGRSNADAKELLQQYQKKLDEAQQEVKLIITQARTDAQHVAEGIVQQSREAATQLQERAKQEIETATTQAIQELANTSATLATELAAKIIKREIKSDTHRDLIDAALCNFQKP